MRHKQSAKFVFLNVAFVLAHFCFMSEAVAKVRTDKNTKITGNDDTTFVFAGRCPNGQPYRLFAYETEIEGKVYSSYNYEGPVGQGTVRTRATPRTMAVRICRVMAEIVDDPV
jgi:hypothetical protein